MRILDRTIDRQSKPFVIAEVAQAHDGSLGNAFAFIDVARQCGADAIKFQTHIASEESTPAEPWRVAFSKQDASRYDYWRRMEFTQDQWRQLKQHADRAGIVFLSSPFSLRACDWLEELGMPAWKVASGEIHNAQLLDRIAATRKPIILSSGLSTIAETTALAGRLEAQGAAVAVLHCTTMYPTPPEETGLNIMQELLGLLSCPVGLSDHSGTIYPAIIAAAQGASLIEVHLTLHRQMFGPDTVASVTPAELSTLVQGVDFAWRTRQAPPSKDRQLASLTKERGIFGRSLVAAREIAAGAPLLETDLAYKKPGGGLRYEDRHTLIGKRARQLLQRDQILKPDDVH